MGMKKANTTVYHRPDGWVSGTSTCYTSSTGTEGYDGCSEAIAIIRYHYLSCLVWMMSTRRMVASTNGWSSLMTG